MRSISTRVEGAEDGCRAGRERTTTAPRAIPARGKATTVAMTDGVGDDVCFARLWRGRAHDCMHLLQICPA